MNIQLLTCSSEPGNTPRSAASIIEISDSSDSPAPHSAKADTSVDQSIPVPVHDADEAQEDQSTEPDVIVPPIDDIKQESPPCAWPNDSLRMDE